MNLGGEEFIDRCIESAPFYIENCLQVADKQTLQPVPFRLKPVQRRLVDRWQEQWDAGRPIRTIILKARREGVSSAVQAFFFWAACTRPHTRCATMSYDVPSAEYLHGMSEFYLHALPDFMRPMIGQSRIGRTLVFGNPSKDPIARAQNPGLGSSLQTISLESGGAAQAVKLLHVSELALPGWESETGKKALKTVIPTVPRAPMTAIIMESTARGVGGTFYTRWRNAVDALTESDDEGRFEPVFIPWFDEPTYTATPPEGMADGLSGEERELQEEFGLSLAQLHWRRLTIRDEGNGDEDWFRQEYPSTWEEAFLTSGLPYFNRQAVARHLEVARKVKPIVRGVVSQVEDGQGKREAIIVPGDRGPIRIWEPPQEDERYVLFCDPSEGVNEHDGRRSHDPQCIYVSPLSRKEIVCSWHGRVERSELGDVCYLLGFLYNVALIGVEVTGGWGNTVVERLKWRRYPRIWRRRPIGKRANRKREELGWDTQPSNRPLMLDSLNKALYADEIVVNDPLLLEECRTFVYGDDGKPAAQPGCHDDRVICASGLSFIWDTEPRIQPDAQRPREPRSVVTGY